MSRCARMGDRPVLLGAHRLGAFLRRLALALALLTASLAHAGPEQDQAEFFAALATDDTFLDGSSSSSSSPSPF